MISTFNVICYNSFILDLEDNNDNTISIFISVGDLIYQKLIIKPEIFNKLKDDIGDKFYDWNINNRYYTINMECIDHQLKILMDNDDYFYVISELFNTNCYKCDGYDSLKALLEKIYEFYNEDELKNYLKKKLDIKIKE